jgi:DNA polymerase-3 subunit alpha
MIPLHNHSQYSALDGFSTMEEIADRCLEIGCPCCGLTDHGVVSGHLDFAQALQAKGIQPIFGCELYHGLLADPRGQGRDQAHLIALARDDEGLRNLWRLVSSTAQADHFHNVGRVFWDDLRKYREGLTITSACIQGLVPQGLMEDDMEPLNRYLDIFGDNFYIEISTYPADAIRDANSLLIAAAQERGIPMVYANDAHYAFPRQFHEHDVYLAKQTGNTIDTPISERKMYHPEGAVCMMTEEVVREHLSYLPQKIVDECIDNSIAIAESITAQLPEVRRHLPVFVPGDCPWLDDDSKALSAEELFVDLVEDGIVDRYGEDASDRVWERATREAEILLDDGIHHYFLMGWDEIQHVKSEGYSVGPGRGSSAGAITAYALGITDIDPLYYDLIFERFWNKGRTKGFPDIDTDFPRATRKRAIRYLKERYGEDRVYAIGTTTYMKPKSVIDKLFKAYGMTLTEAEELKEIVGQTTKIEILGHDQIGWSEDLEPGKVYYVEKDCGVAITQWVMKDQPHRARRAEFVNACRTCCSRVAQYGVHASGIVVADVPLDEWLPVYMRGVKDDDKVAATMFTMSDVDKLQFVKLDVLGLRTLDVLQYWKEMMAEKGVDIEWSGMDKEEQPEEMWQMLHDGYTAGIFQVEDGYGRQLCKRMLPNSVEDLAIIVALTRPGPIQAKIPDAYIARRNGEQEITYESERLEEILDPILHPTYGLFVYQEQIIGYFNSLGYTLGESDAVRKILGKKQPQDLVALRDGLGEWKDRGYFDMARAAGLSDAVAESVWQTLEGFADYCFNKSHAVAYGVVTLRTIFAKYYAAAEFYAACMRSFDPSKDRKKKAAMAPMYVNEARRLDIPVYPPHIRESRGYSHVNVDGAWYFGFEDIFSVGHSGDYIVELREEIGIDISTPESFEEAFSQYSQNFLADQSARKKAGEMVAKVKSPKQLLQANKIQALYEVGAWETMESDGRTLTAQQDKELELLSVILTDNVAEVKDRNAEEISSCDNFAELMIPWDTKMQDETDEYDYLEFKVYGTISNVVEKRSKASGKPFGIVTIDNDLDQCEFMVWNNKWKSHKKFLFQIRTPGIFTLRQQPPNDYGESYIFERGYILK